MKHPELLPTQWRDRVGGAGSQETARVIIDYIAGMTDRYALTQWKDLTEKGACAV
jgi:dGTPase